MRYWLLLILLLSPWVSASAELYVVASPKSPIMEINKSSYPLYTLDVIAWWVTLTLIRC